MKAVLERNLGFMGYPDYSVDTDGNVYSYPNKTRSGIRQLKPKTRPNGYQYVNLCYNGNVKSYAIHRLVAMAFIDNINKMPQVNHKDENRQNNKVINLEWCTAKYNSNYGTRIDKLCKHINQFNKNGEFIKEWKSSVEIENTLCINHRHITRCARGQRKSAGGFIWKYK